MSQPSPAQRVAHRLEHLPDACRALEAQCDRTAARGGGTLTVHLHLDAHGAVVALELVTRFERRADQALTSVG